MSQCTQVRDAPFHFSHLSVIGIGGLCWVFFQLSLIPGDTMSGEFKKYALEYLNALHSVPQKETHLSFITMPHVGTHVLRALLSQDGVEKAKHTEKLLNIVDAADYESWSELLYGLSGLLVAFDLLSKHAQGQFEHTQRRIIDMIFQRSYSSDGFPLMWQWHGSEYLGAAHGLSGILAILLHHHWLLTETELDLIWRTIESILTLQDMNGNFPSRCSPSRHSNELVQWCHGSPGVTIMLLKAYRIYPLHRSLLSSHIKRALNCIWERGLLKKGVGLCHGISGNAFVFLMAWRILGDDSYLHMAQQFADFGLEHYPEFKPDHPFSLFEGTGALLLLCHQLLNVETVTDGYPCMLE